MTATRDHVLAGVEADATEVLVDPWSKLVKTTLADAPEARDARIATALAG